MPTRFAIIASESVRRILPVLTLALLGWGAVVADAAEPTTRQSPPGAVGVNFDFVVDYSSEVPFVDLFKTSREWIPQQAGREWGEGPALDFSEDGREIRSLAPGQYASTLICCEKGIPAGRYICLYEGKGDLDFEEQAQVVEDQPGRLVIMVQPPGDFILHLRSTDASDPVRNIRIVMPGHETTFEQSPFNPLFLEQKSKYSLLRYKDWQQVDDSKIRRWSERPRMDDPSQAHRGVAIGWMVKLSNTLHTDPWFCMPHLADDDYVRHFAEEVRDTLDPDRKIYIEYTNEAWNAIFAQNRYVRDQARELNLPGDDYQAGLAFYSQRTVEVFAIWEDVFGGTDRLVRVIAGQADNPWVSEQMLEYEKTFEHADVLAIAPYFGHEFGVPENAARVNELTVDDALEVCRRDLPRLRRDVEANAAIAKRFGLPLIAYEGGQHLWALDGAENNVRFTNLIIAANRDPRMKQIYAQHLSDWKASGGQLYVAYKSVGAPSRWGAWGLREYEGQDITDAPKYDAIQEFIQNNPRWWPLSGHARRADN